MGSVADINSGLGDLPSPLCAKPGDKFLRVVFNEDPPFIMQPGGFLYVQFDAMNFAGLHVIRTEDGPTLVSLNQTTDGLIYVASYHSSYPSYKCEASELDIVGLVVEMYPTGDPKRRWILYQEGLTFSPPYERLHLVSDQNR